MQSRAVEPLHVVKHRVASRVEPTVGCRELRPTHGPGRKPTSVMGRSQDGSGFNAGAADPDKLGIVHGATGRYHRLHNDP
jgi:hypothetical protein